MIEELRRFIIVANEGNLTRASKLVFITQSALTQSVQRLEKEIGAKLFIQKGKYLELTPDGKALKSMGERIIELWDKAKDPKLRESFKPAITIGMFDNAAQRLAGFVQKNTPSQDFTLEFVIDNSGKLLTQLQLGIIDIAILVLRNSPYPKEITCVRVFEEELVPVAGRVFSEPIEKIPFILYNKGSNTRDQIDEVFIKHGIKPKIYAESTSTQFMLELAQLNCGVALVPENLVKVPLKEKKLYRQDVPMSFIRNFGLLINRNKNSKIISNFTNEMVYELSNKSNFNSPTLNR